jgi:hypothetical protein
MKFGRAIMLTTDDAHDFWVRAPPSPGGDLLVQGEPHLIQQSVRLALLWPIIELVIKFEVAHAGELRLLETGPLPYRGSSAAEWRAGVGDTDRPDTNCRSVHWRSDLQCSKCGTNAHRQRTASERMRDPKPKRKFLAASAPSTDWSAIGKT